MHELADQVWQCQWLARYFIVRDLFGSWLNSFHHRDVWWLVIFYVTCSARSLWKCPNIQIWRRVLKAIVRWISAVLTRRAFVLCSWIRSVWQFINTTPHRACIFGFGQGYAAACVPSIVLHFLIPFQFLHTFLDMALDTFYNPFFGFPGTATISMCL